MRKITLAWLFICTVILSSCSQNEVVISTPTEIPIYHQESYFNMTDECRASVDYVKTLQRSLPSPNISDDSDIEAEHIARVKRFDVNDYLIELDHLSVEDGYYFSHLQYYDFPKLYAAREGIEPFILLDTFIDYFDDENGVNWYDQIHHLEFSYKNHILIDDVPEGYFQFFVLETLGEQFDLYWTGYYNDTIMICDSSDVSMVKEEAWDNEHDYEFDSEFFSTLDITPYVKMNDDSVVVRFFTYSNWGGVFENVITIERGSSYYLIERRKTNWVEFDCQIVI